MDIYLFIVEMTKTLAWPIASLVIVFLIKDKLEVVLSSIKSFKYKDIEATFAKGVSDVSTSAQASIELEGNKHEETSKLVSISPRGAVLESWLSVEKAMRSYLDRYGHNDSPPDERHISIVNSDYTTIGQGVFEMLHELRKLRNQAVHLTDSQINEETAKKYSVLAARVASKLDEA